MQKICSQVPEITASGANKSTIAQGRFRNKGKIIRRKKKLLLLQKKELCCARLFRVRICTPEKRTRASQCIAWIGGRHRYILPCYKADAACMLFLPLYARTSGGSSSSAWSAASSTAMMYAPDSIPVTGTRSPRKLALHDRVRRVVGVIIRTGTLSAACSGLCLVSSLPVFRDIRGPPKKRFEIKRANA